MLVDLPGYGYSKASRGEQRRWASDVDTYLSQRETLRGVILIGDIRHFPTRSDSAAIDWLAGLSCLPKRTSWDGGRGRVGSPISLECCRNWT
jgi:GTP-binding protein EngB required for normal cell division